MSWWTTLSETLAARHDARLRRWYAGSKGNAIAKGYARVWAYAFARGALPQRWVTLRVPGRRTGKPTEFPLGMADLDGRWYLVSMLGECNWTKNVRAAGGAAQVVRKGVRDVQLVEIPVADRPPLIKRYLEQVPGGRPHIPVDHRAPVEDFVAVAGRIPVFEVRGR